MTAAPNLSDFTTEEIKTILDEVRHPFDIAIYASGNYFNMASIIRSSHCFLVNNVHIFNTEHMKERDLYYRKGDMGTAKYQNIHIWESEESFVEHTKEQNKNLVCFENRPGILSPKSIWSFAYPENPILVFGSEKHGVSDYMLSQAKDIVCIPMFGVTNDLNLGVAAGIAMNDFVAKYNIKQRFANL